MTVPRCVKSRLNPILVRTLSQMASACRQNVNLTSHIVYPFWTCSSRVRTLAASEYVKMPSSIHSYSRARPGVLPSGAVGEHHVADRNVTAPFAH